MDQQHYPCAHCGYLVANDDPACPRCGRELSGRLRPNYHALGIALIVATLLALLFFAFN